jgi:Myb-like DNA-binding domain
MSDDFVKGRWEDSETTELVSQIRSWLHHHTNGATSTLVDFTQLAQLVEEMKIQIPWSLISKRMGRRSRLSCFKKWQKLVSESEFRATVGDVTTAETTTATASIEAIAAPTILLEEQLHEEEGKNRPIKRRKTKVPPQQVEEVEEVELDDDEQQQVVEYIVPMTDAHVAEAELAAETVEALGLPDLIASKT